LNKLIIRFKLDFAHIDYSLVKWFELLVRPRLELERPPRSR